MKVRTSARKDPRPKHCLIRLTCYLLKIMNLYPSFQSPSNRIIISGLSAIMCLSFYISRSVSLSLCLFIYLSTSLFINLSIFLLVLLLLLVVEVAVIVVTPAQIIVVATVIVMLRNYGIKYCVLLSGLSIYRSSYRNN